MCFAGQKCTATSRVIVDRTVLEPFLSAIRAEVEKLPVALPTETDCAVGPVISRAKRDELLSLVAAERARVVCGGGAPVGERLVRRPRAPPG